MKKKIIVCITIASTCASLIASDKQPSSAWQRARSRLDAAHGRAAPELPQTAPKALPTLQDVVAAVDDETTFNTTLRAFLDRNPGCKIWDESCPDLCEEWTRDVIRVSNLDKIFDNDRSISSCKNWLGSCYQHLRGCPQKTLDELLKRNISRSYFAPLRCELVRLICQGANPNVYNDAGITIMHAAVGNNDYYLVQFLLKHGTDVNAKDKHNKTPLINLAESCVYNISIINTAAILLDAGAEKHHRVSYKKIYPGQEYQGMTASEIARSEQKYAPCKTLADFLENYEKQPNRVQD